ncbi:hypothetical protein B0O99DRAFT_629750 [Bisporella sp. PMI_857]|nr:hypothetical protein B0O99DRAFT_629750 [Bisporella sp. PMI_857]
MKHSTTLPHRIIFGQRCSRRALQCSYETSSHVRLLSRLYSELRPRLPDDDRARLSKFWVPSGGIAELDEEDSHAKLIRAGFLRQAHSGIFHMLPLGLRVQNKLEVLIDKYMSKLGASKLSLSSISSEELWTKSGRLLKAGSEIFRFRDRKDAGFLLSPTHEEEITNLVSTAVKSYKELPVRLYQISRKYRDELRPRQGLLRSREFIMKDLYTFDYSSERALKTYHEVRGMYARLFDELKVPYLTAEADSGDIGGDLSHEFHFPTSKGEDNIISCDSCNYVANEELAESTVHNVATTEEDATQLAVWRGISRDRQTLVNVWYLTTGASTTIGQPEVNVHAVKSIVPGLDASIDDPLPLWPRSKSTSLSLSSESPTASKKSRQLINLIDLSVPARFRGDIESRDSMVPFWPESLPNQDSDLVIDIMSQDMSTQQPLNLIRIRDGDSCSRCSTGSLKVQKAIELGHTFHLGTRYSKPMEAMVTVPAGLLIDEAAVIPEVAEKNSNTSVQVPMQMGCHGIGVSRIIGAVVDTLSDDKGLNWPRVMAPFEAVLVPTNGLAEASVEVYDELRSTTRSSESSQLDVVLDDRVASFPWKMRDADLVGYPVIIVVGRKWNTERTCEVQCRRLQIRQDVPLRELESFVQSVLAQL